MVLRITGLIVLFFILTSSARAASSYPDSALVILRQFLKIPSISGHEGKAGAFLQEKCRERGLSIKIFTDEDSCYNFAASIYPLESGKPNILFLSHLDVVPPGDTSKWSHGPFNGELADDTIYGRGVIDMKGIAIMQLMALQRFKKISDTVDLPYNITMLAVSGEETGGYNGARIITEHYLDILNPVAVFGEGGSGIQNILSSDPHKTVFGISIAEKRNLWLELTLGLKTYGHGSAPPKRYANKNMLEALGRLTSRKPEIDFSRSTRLMFRELGKLERGLQKMVMKNLPWKIYRPVLRKKMNEEPMMKVFLTNTVTITNISNPPGAPNQISTNIKAILDCRLLPRISTKKMIREIKHLLSEPGIEIRVIDEAPFAKESKPGIFYGAFEEALIEVFPGSAVVPVLFPATTDNNFFRAKGVPVFGIMPVILSDELMECVHNVNERLPVEAVEKGIDTYISFLQKIQFHQERYKMDRFFLKGEE